MVEKLKMIKLQRLVFILAIFCCVALALEAPDAVKTDLIAGFLKNHKHILVATYFGCNDLLQVAKDTMDANIFVKSVGFGANVTLDIDHIIPVTLFRQSVILDVDCNDGDVKRLLQKASERNMFNESYHWLLVQDDTTSSTISSSFLDTLNINLNSEIMWAILSATNRYNLYDVWNPCHALGGEVNVTMVGAFSRASGFEMSGRFPSTIIRRMNMKKLAIRCGAVIVTKIHESYEHFLTTTHNPEEEGFNRHSYVLMQYVRDIFNFKIRTVRLQSWGYERNKTADGLIAALANGVADIGCAGLFVREYRFKYISYVSVRGWTLRPTFIFRHPQSDGEVRNIFMQPFETSVWLCIVAAGLLYILLIKGINELEMKLITKSSSGRHASKSIKKVEKNAKSTIGIAELRPKLPQNRRVAHELPTNGILGIWKVCLKSFDEYKSKLYNRAHINHTETDGPHHRWSEAADDQSSEERYSFTLSFLVFLSALCQQGATVNPTMLSSRCALLSCLIFGICIFQYYSAAVVGALISEKPKTLKTLRQLADSSLKLSVEDIAYNRDYLINTNDPIAQEMYRKKIQTVDKKTGNVTYNFLPPKEGLEIVQHGGFAFHVDVATAYKIIADTFSEREVCDLAEIPLYRPEDMIFPVPHRSPFRKMISYGMQRLSEAGIIRYRQKLYLTSQPKCVRKLQASDLKVNFNSISSAIIFLLVGYALSLTAFIGEVFYKRWRNLQYTP